MNKKQILAIGRNMETMQKVLQLINQNENWSGKGSITDQNAEEMFKNGNYDLVLLGGAIEVDSGIKLRKVFTEQNPDIIILQHFGGIGSLSADIQNAFPQEELIQ